MSKTLQAVLFDMDGTLVDSQSMHFVCWSKLLKPYGVSYLENDYSHATYRMSNLDEFWQWVQSQL